MGRDQISPASWALGKRDGKLQEGIEEVGVEAGRPGRRLVHRYRAQRMGPMVGRMDWTQGVMDCRDGGCGLSQGSQGGSRN